MLEVLPVEIRQEIFNQLSVNDLLSVSHINKTHREDVLDLPELREKIRSSFYSYPSGVCDGHKLLAKLAKGVTIVTVPEWSVVAKCLQENKEIPESRKDVFSLDLSLAYVARITGIVGRSNPTYEYMGKNFTRGKICLFSEDLTSNRSLASFGFEKGYTYTLPTN